MSDIKISTGHPDAGRIYAQALDRLTAERDALQADLDDRDQRVDELEGLLREVLHYDSCQRTGVGFNLGGLLQRIQTALSARAKPNRKPNTCCGSCPADYFKCLEGE